MKVNQLKYPVKIMANLFEVSVSGFYDWLHRKPSKRSLLEKTLAPTICAAHERTRKVYGTRRLQKELFEEGILVGRDRLGRLRHQLGIVCRQKRKFKVTTDSNHDQPIAPNLLDQQFEANCPNQVWVADITYIPTQEGWLYLAGIKDLFTCEIVGYAMDESMTEELVSQALFQAVLKAKPKVGLVHHSDRGSQYCAHGYRKSLATMGIQASMSRRGNCYDNAPMESFWGTLKNELVHHCRYATRDEAMSTIREYIEIFYNRQRRHSRLGYVSPAVFLQTFNRLKPTG